MSRTEAGGIETAVALRRDGRLLLARDRMRLLEAVAAQGAIAPAAREVGVSYKTAWEAIDALNNLSARPVVTTQAGGRAGGGAAVTPEGRRLIAAFQALEARLEGVAGHLAAQMAGADDPVAWALGLRFSARNVFFAEVEEVRFEAVEALAKLRASQRHRLEAQVTHEAAEALDLAPGRRVLALVKAGAVKLSSPGGAPGSNRFDVETLGRSDGPDRVELRLDLGEGKTLTSLAPRGVADALALAPGVRVCASFAPGDVMLVAG